MRSGEQEQNSALRKRVASAHATESVRTRASPSPCRPATRRPKNCHRQRQQRQPFLVPMRTTTRRSMRRHPKSRGPIRATPLVRMGAIQPPAADDAEGSSLVCATDCGTIVFSLLATRYFARYSLLRQQTPLKKSLLVPCVDTLVQFASFAIIAESRCRAGVALSSHRASRAIAPSRRAVESSRRVVALSSHRTSHRGVALSSHHGCPRI
jgi:hypothetical protein